MFAPCCLTSMSASCLDAIIYDYIPHDSILLFYNFECTHVNTTNDVFT